MRITQIVQETTTSGSVATVAAPLFKQSRKGGNLLTGTKTKKKYANSLSEGKMKELAMDLKSGKDGLTDEEFKKKYGVTKQEMRKSLGSKPEQVKEAEISEQDLILVPGQGHKFKTGFVPHAQDRTDHEVEMALSDLFQAAKNAKEVYQIVKTYSEEEGLEGWVQEKIIKANDYLNTIREYLEHRQLTKEGMKGAMVGGAAGAAITKTPMGSLKGASLGSDIEDMFKEAIHGAGVIGNGMAGESANHQVEGGPMTKAMDTLSEILNAADEQKDIRVKIGNKIGPISKEYANTIKLLFSRANAVGKGDRFVKLFTSVPSFVELITNPQFKKAHIQANIKKASPEGFRGTAIYKHMDKATSGVEEKPKFDIVAEKAVSKAQQKFMGIVHAAQKGEKRQALMKQKKEIEAQLKQDVAEGEGNKQKYEMMMRNGQVKKFIAKDDADAKRIAAGHGAKSVIKMKGNVPGGKIAEQGMAEGSDPTNLWKKHGEAFANYDYYLNGESGRGRNDKEKIAKYANQIKQIEAKCAAEFGPEVCDAMKAHSKAMQNTWYGQRDRQGERMADQIRQQNEIDWDGYLDESGMAEGKIDFAKKLQQKIDKSNKAVVQTKKDIGHRIADIGPGGKEHNVKTNKTWDDANKVVEGVMEDSNARTPDLSKIRTHKLEELLALQSEIGRKDPRTKASADLIRAELKKRGQNVGEGAKVDRMVKHVEKSEEKAGKSKQEAENIAWATANKRGMLDNKNKK